MVYSLLIDQFVEKTFAEMADISILKSFTNGELIAERKDKHIDDTIDSTFTINRGAIQNLQNKAGLKIPYTVHVATRVGVHIGPLEIQHITVSTKGQHAKGDLNKRGASAHLDFMVKAGKEGRFDLSTKLFQASSGL